jgi:hypothetical protein
MPFDLKNPSAKEILVIGGGAAGLAIIYMYMQKKKAPAAATPSSAAPAATSATASDGAPFTGTAMRASGAPSTGNAFTDAIQSTPVSTALSPTGTVTTSSKAATPKVPVLHASQGASAILGSPSVSAASVPAAATSLGSAVSTTAAQVYQALTKAGLLPYQAAGVLGNIQNESTFRTEVAAMDTNGKMSYGLIQWNAGSYPNASQYVTGNAAKDLQTQAAAIVNLFRTHNIGGTTAAQVAGNWAAQVEVCQGCQPGGSQWTQRVANATAIFQQVVSGAFNAPKAKSQPATAATNTNAFPGGLAAEQKWWAAHPNATSYGGPGSGVSAATAKQIAGLFPTVKPGAKATTPAGIGKGLTGSIRPKAKPKPLTRTQLSSIGKNLFGGVTRLAAYITPRKAPPKVNQAAASRQAAERRIGIRAV